MMISIIIPSFNRATIISETLESVIFQTYKQWEVIIVDDGSTDSSLVLLKKYADVDNRIKYFTRPFEMLKGANSCRNFGFLQAKGKYVKFLDSDDLLTPDALQKQITVLENDDHLKVCMSYGRYFNNQTRELEEFWSRNKEYPDYLLGHITNQMRWAISDPLWRKSFFDKPPFKEGLMNSQEWLMHGQALVKLNKGEIFNLKETFTLIRRGNERMSSSKSSFYYKNQRKARLFLLRNILVFKPLSFLLQIQLIKQILVFTYWVNRTKK